ncbi:heavy metal translocating P-type ATPase [Albimonas sp. CAU 1670]|uniref:heavy metal translocating P-type ATPase n=1 Tax=Albimonas sp. CAU 1670 TaxID=3032599 RepID=UPI0023D99618|nr:heavy metal translocating P-type ATPase [Albimonas sp. CAU 1670]MDF2232828.1 heavy metal translocating P-type ATPase [Albimonas sp. CAU 1670]
MKDAALQDLDLSPESPATAASAPGTLSVSVAGMTCAGCAGRVERALTALPGVAAAQVNLALERADLALAPTPAAGADIARALREAGFAGREETVTLAVRGMTCASCAGRVQRALEAAPGVISAEVNLAIDQAEVRRLRGSGDLADLIAAVKAAGYEAAPSEAGAAPAEDDRPGLERWDLPLAALLTAPLLIQMIAMQIDPAWRMPGWVELILAAPVFLWCGRRFHRGALAAARARTANMDTLVSLGTTAAVGFSTWMLLTAHAGHAPHLYFEAAAVIITLVLAGKALEARAKRAASAALRELMALRPERACILRGGEEVEVAVAEVSVGDMVILRPGERAPVDGTVVRGESEFDESLVTGEPLPVPRRIGDAVPAGAVNGAGLVRLRADRVGRDTTLARIADMVAKAQTGKAPVQRLVDRIAAVFVPAVLAIAALTLAGWLVAGASLDVAVSAAISVLVIACPCALGLATPTALVAGTGAAAKAGILIKDIATLERAAHIDAVIFDKTGTLTMGKPEVAEVRPLASLDREALMTLAASAQRGSEHPLGRAMVAAADGLALSEPEGFRAVVGEGIEATVDGAPVRIGRQDFAAPEAPQALRAQAAEMAGAGRTVVWVAREGEALGLIALADAPREDAAAAVQALKRRGVAVSLLTGDAEPAARAIAARLGIEDVTAGVKPEGKAQAVAALTAQGRRVAMVGDGINDAPALAAADLGIAMGGGADAAMETAGVALVRPRPTLVASALDIAAATSTKIKQNLFWAFAWNTLCIPVAAAGLLDPALAGAAMALSSVTVVGNSILLTRWTPVEPAAEPALQEVRA